MRNFAATVKERQVGEPCRIVFELDSDIGLADDRWITLNMPEGTGLAEAKEVAQMLNAKVARISLT